MNQQKYYDYIIVGAGIAGLYTAHELCKKYPLAKICILEATKYIGGRLHSIKYDGLIMQAVVDSQKFALVENEESRVVEAFTT